MSEFHPILPSWQETPDKQSEHSVKVFHSRSFQDGSEVRVDHLSAFYLPDDQLDLTITYRPPDPNSRTFQNRFLPENAMVIASKRTPRFDDNDPESYDFVSVRYDWTGALISVNTARLSNSGAEITFTPSLSPEKLGCAISYVRDNKDVNIYCAIKPGENSMAEHVLSLQDGGSERCRIEVGWARVVITFYNDGEDPVSITLPTTIKPAALWSIISSDDDDKGYLHYGWDELLKIMRHRPQQR